MIEPERATAGYDPADWPDGGWHCGHPGEWEPWDDEDWLHALDPADVGLRRVRDLRTAPGLLDGDRTAGHDDEDEERRP